MRRKAAFIIERILRLGKNDIRIVAAAVAAVSITPPNCTGYDPCGLPRLEDSTDRKRKGSACDENESKRHRVCDLSSDEDDDSQYEKDLALFNLKGNVYLTEEVLNINYRYVVKMRDKLPDRVAVSREEAIAAYERLQHKLVNEDTDQS